ncbi:type I-F CRISPR-associated protein Csy1 [Pseudoalteromonas fuliginea]|uniref:Type I-F CRISPR-associated protein Csy1 n=1 Tax=Pseudoalteromonas fuliginea TaxID=1872678 RepID=A0ABQ6RFP7_9GAMM|nr:type I-F CRISPR-associated protein Csy1 [Pseudoalteromonas fuliginea]KAA1152866.1 type I-F CRISPR-associated protein Csy1 [Pseudoalteromonas fuliginea]KAA1166470.1 type I-F CRISPR-associated protein Csy1 [Pseudoalteromonas fuliginea]
MEATLTQALADYIEQRKQAKLEPFQKALNKVLEKSENETEIATAKAEYAEKSAPIEEGYKPVMWLTDAARRAKQISLATHAAKFTHSDAKASSILVSQPCTDSHTINNQYLVTTSLTNKAIDAVGNAAALDVAKLLNITVNGESLITQLQQNHAQALSAFTDNDELLQTWVDGFKLALADEKLSSHNLSKQIYFPIKSESNDLEYHLLCPLFSSALAHNLHKKVTDTRFGDSKNIRDARRANKYDERMDISFPNTAVQSFGGSKPQNISQLNSERYGQNFLLNTAPPTFQAQVKPPINNTSLFNRQLTYKISGYLRDFKAFLSKLNPEENNFKVRYKRDYHFILPILDQLMIHAANIQTLPAGWASESHCKLKPAHALWLDVYNPHEGFKREREKLDWQAVIAADFASWLIKQLKNDEKYRLGDIEHAYFSKVCLHQLKRFEHNTPKLAEA